MMFGSLTPLTGTELLDPITWAAQERARKRIGIKDIEKLKRTEKRRRRNKMSRMSRRANRR